jgi:hypothetical protein
MQKTASFESFKCVGFKLCGREKVTQQHDNQKEAWGGSTVELEARCPAVLYVSGSNPSEYFN